MSCVPPLNAIIGYSEIIEEEAIESGHQNTVKDVSKIQAAARHLLYVISEILDLSKIEAGQMLVFPEKLDIKHLMVDIISIIKPMVEANNNVFEYTCTDGNATINTDFVKLRQILLNLLSNAAKFCHNGKISLNISLFDNTLNVLVSDTGIGLSAHQISLLYKPFVQADESTTRKYGGTGLGLTITKQFCEMLGGNLNVTSAPGVGTTFRLQLPDYLEKKDPDVQNAEQNKSAA